MSESKRAQWLKRVSGLPTAPGVYIMKDRANTVVYVGKANSLRARVRQYFQEGSHDYRAFIGLLGGILSDIETRVTRTEKEALLLERELIRLHEPRFNVIWRDDKQYLCLRVDTSHDYPWVEVVRTMKQDGARYFGPFHSASAARQTLRVVNRHFKLRTCRDSTLYNRNRACLEYQIGRCLAPCVIEIDKGAYKESVDDVLMFLEGKGHELAKRLERRMWTASEREAYETASHYRDQLRAVQKTLQRQNVAFAHLKDQDVFGLYREGEAVSLAIVEVRGGRVENIAIRMFEQQASDDETVLVTAVLQRYQDGGIALDEVVMPLELHDAEALSEVLSEQSKRKVKVLYAQRGDRKEVLKLAFDNAQHGFHEQRRKLGGLHSVMKGLQDSLHLSQLPQRIECYDISNLGSDHIVASGVTFTGGLPDKKRYRHYKIKRVGGQDDFACMYEVLTRRFVRGLKEDDLPSLVMVDGGKGQLNVAKAVFADLNVQGVDLISLAKSRVKGKDGDDATTRSAERVFLKDAREPVVLRQSSAELLLLARLRDEAHRFAITFQRSTRQKAKLHSSLDDIPGIGPTKRRALLAHLGSFQRVKAASPQVLAEVPGIGPKAARVIWATLNPGAAAESDVTRGIG